MNYEFLHSFAEFAKTCNFTRAAEALHISQPALHVQIKKLSESLGLLLYQKRGRELFLTAEGEEVAAYAREIALREQELVFSLGKEPKGPVTLAAGQGAFLYLLGAAIRAFPKERWPLRLMTLAGPDALEAVLSAKAHIGVGVIDEDAARNLQTEPLRVVGQMAVVPKSHPLAGRRRLRLRDLHQVPLVLPPEGNPQRDRVGERMQQCGAELQVAVEARGWELSMEFARSGLGVAVVNDFCTPPRGCVGIAIPELPEVSYSVFSRKTKHPGVQRLLQLVRKEK